MKKKMGYRLRTAMQILFFGLLLLLPAAMPVSAVEDPEPENFLEQLDIFWQTIYTQGLSMAADGQPLLPVELLAKARPDECFFGIWKDPDSTPEFPNIYDPEQTVDCDHNKVNQAYVWGMAKSGNDIWFGTGSNVNCLVQASYLGLEEHIRENEAYVCEFGYSQYLRDLQVELTRLGYDMDISELPMDLIGDWRPPRIFVYNTVTKILSEKTPLVQPPYPYPQTLANATIGIRSAGTLGNVVILGGPSALGGIDLYAFNSDTGNYLGSTNLNALAGENNIVSVNNIRKWLAVDGVLYTTVGVTCADGNTGGRVLRWKGDADSPFDFEVVGTLDSAGSELAFHKGRLFVSTWAGGGEISAPSTGNSPAGIFMSPVIPSGGLTTQHNTPWQKVWSVTDYEPDPIMAATYGCGALVSFDGYLFWGTMHVPGLGWVSQLQHTLSLAGSSNHVYYEDAGTRQEHYEQAENYITIRNNLRKQAARRAVSIFRGKNFGQAEEAIDLVYGQKEFPEFILAEDTVSHDDEISADGYVQENEIHYTVKYEMVPNNMGGAEPLHGPSGFGNRYNGYTWTMQVFQDQMYVGTMNYAIIAFRGEVPDDYYQAPSMGANLFRFAGADAPAVPERLDGMGNYASYGIRTMISDDALYLGMANPMNLLQDDQGKNIGGWELIKLGKWTAAAGGTGKIGIEMSAAAGTPFIDHITTMAANDPDINQAGKPAGQEFPDGLISFTVRNLATATVQVTLTLPGTYPDDARYYKITGNGFEEFLDDNGTPLYAFNGSTVTLTLTDGDKWDKDGAENGEISDPGGPAVISSSSSGGGGCFITTLFGR